MNGRQMLLQPFIWIAGAVLAVSVVTTQAAPSLTGTWVIDREKTAAAAPSGGAPAQGGGMRGSGGGVSPSDVAVASGGGVAATGGGMRGGGGMSPEWTIMQSSTTLTITRTLPDGSSQNFVHRLDGSESINVNGRTTFTSRTIVGGAKFTTTGTQVVKTDEGDVTSEVKEVRSLDKDGALVVETTRTIDGTSRTSTNVLMRKK